MAQSRDEAFQENIDRGADALMACVQKRAELERVGATDHVRVVNVAQFALLWNADLNSLLDDLDRLRGTATHAAGWKRKLAARLLAVTVVEAGDEFASLLAKDFRASVQAVAGAGALPPLNILHRELHEFRREHDAALRAIRNTVIAHRDPDARAQVDALAAVDVKAIEALGWKLVGWNNRLFGFLSDVMGQARAA